MARDITGGGSRSKKPSVGQQRLLRDIKKAQARKQLGSIKGIAGIVGGAVLEGIGGPKARGAKVAVKTSAKLARAIAREAAGDKAKGMTVRKVPLYKLDKAKMTVKGGSSTTIKKGTSAKRAPLTKAERDKLNEVTVRYDSPKKLKAAAQARKDAPRARRENVPAPSRNATPRKPISKSVRRARTVDQLGKSSASRLEKKVAAREEAKLTARKNRANRPALAAKNKAAIARAGEKRLADKKRIAGEKAFYNDKTPAKSTKAVLTNEGKIVDLPSKMTEGELRQLRFKLKQSALHPKNTLRGKPQRTIDERQPRGKGLSDKEIEILRTVGKRDYSRGEVNPLAQKIVQGEADRRVIAGVKDPKSVAQDRARTNAAIEKANQDNGLGRTLRSKRKNFRGKPMK